MRHLRTFGLVAVLALSLSGCGREPQSYEATIHAKDSESSNDYPSLYVTPVDVTLHLMSEETLNIGDELGIKVFTRPTGSGFSIGPQLVFMGTLKKDTRTIIELAKGTYLFQVETQEHVGSIEFDYLKDFDLPSLDLWIQMNPKPKP